MSKAASYPEHYRYVNFVSVLVHPLFLLGSAETDPEDIWSTLRYKSGALRLFLRVTKEDEREAVGPCNLNSVAAPASSWQRDWQRPELLHRKNAGTSNRFHGRNASNSSGPPRPASAFVRGHAKRPTQDQGHTVGKPRGPHGVVLAEIQSSSLDIEDTMHGQSQQT